jgi:hypothetical protein
MKKTLPVLGLLAIVISCGGNSDAAQTIDALRKVQATGNPHTETFVARMADARYAYRKACGDKDIKSDKVCLHLYFAIDSYETARRTEGYEYEGFKAADRWTEDAARLLGL